MFEAVEGTPFVPDLGNNTPGVLLTRVPPSVPFLYKAHPEPKKAR